MEKLVDIPEGMEELAKKYIMARRTEAVEMQEMLANQDFENLRILAHNMKGTGLSYGFATITDLGREIEEQSKRKDQAAIEEQLLKLKEYIHQAAQIVLI